MNIGINGTLLSSGEGYRQTGVNRYIARLVEALPAAMADAAFLVYTGRGVGVPADCVARPSIVALDNPAIRILWERTALPVLTRRDRLAIFHGAVNTLPARLACPSVVTVHDLALLRWPEQVPARRFRYLAKAIRDAVRIADRVIAVSEATRDDLIELLGVEPAKIAVTPLGVERRFAPPGAGVLAAFKARNRLDTAFILTVGTLEPRKNLPRLLESFAALQAEIPHQLVLVGPEGWRQGPLNEALESLKLGDRVLATGFVPDEELPLWYAAADLVALPSLYEGFGLPVLEAMACGAVVVTSNVSSLPEVAGDAAILVDPLSVEAIADGIRRALSDQELRTKLRVKGMARARAFTWERTAALTAGVYREVLG